MILTLELLGFNFIPSVGMLLRLLNMSAAFLSVVLIAKVTLYDTGLVKVGVCVNFSVPVCTLGSRIELLVHVTPAKTIKSK